MHQAQPRRTFVAFGALAAFILFAAGGTYLCYKLLQPKGPRKDPRLADPIIVEPLPVKIDTDCTPQRPKARPGEGPQWFVDITEETGIDFQHAVGPLGTYFMPESIGAGGALFDFDNDGDLDLFLVNCGRSPKATGEFPAGLRTEGRLFRQDADGAFQEVTAESGLACNGYGAGCAIGDIDNDGYADLYVTNYGQDALFHNNGDGTFTDITESSAMATPQWGTGAVFLDYDRDANLDLFVVNYTTDDRHGHSVACGNATGRVSYCGPLKFQTTSDQLFRNEGRFADNDDGRHAAGAVFTDVTTRAGIDTAPTYGFAAISADFNNDSWPDVYVANDAGPKRLWMNQKDGFFLDIGAQSGAGFDMVGRPQGSMGLAMGDVEGDGDFDFVVTNLATEGASYYRKLFDGQYVATSEYARLKQPTLPHTGWGVALIDLDHDGDLDLPMVNGLVIPCGSGFAPHGEETFEVKSDRIDDPAAYWREYADPNLLFLNERGRFTEASESGGAFCAAVGSGRALIYGDIDDDGDLDLVVTNCGERARIYRNEMPKSGSWLKVRLIDRLGHRDAYGALVTVAAGGKRRIRSMNTADSYLASNDGRLHFGLGDADQYEAIEVRWPDGAEERFAGGPTNSLVTLIRGEGQAIEDPAPDAGE